MNKTIKMVLASLGLASISGISSQASTLYWNNTGTAWTTASSWSDSGGVVSAVVPGAADNAVFNFTGLNIAETISMGANQSALSMTFDNTGATTLAGGGNRDMAIGSGGITVSSGAGAVTFGTTSSGFNVYARIIASQTWTNNSANQLRMVNAASAAVTGTTPVTLTVSNTSTGATTFSNTLNNGGAGAVLTLVINSSGTGVTNLASGTYSGGTSVLAGSVSSSGYGTGDITVGDTSGSAAVSVATNTAALANNIVIQAGSTGAKTLTTSGAAGVLSGTVTLNDNVVLAGTGASTTYSGVISGVGGLSKSSAATTIVLSGANTYSGSTSILGGTLSASSLNSVVGGTTTSSLGAPITATNGTIGIGATSAGILKYTGTGETTDRVINLAGTTTGATLDQSGTGVLKFTSALTATGAGSKTLTLLGSTAGTGEIAGAIVDNSGTNKTNLTKAGTGTWTLSGTNTYTGTTSVTAGTLLVNSGVGGVGAVSASGTGLIGGSGTITTTGTNAISFATGSGVDLSATTGTNTLTLNLSGTANASFATGSTFSFDLAASNASDILAFTGMSDASIAAFNSNSVTITNATTGLFTLFTFDGISALDNYSGALSNSILGLGGMSGTWVYNANSIQLNVTAVPEPSTYGLLGMGLGALWFLRRKKGNNA